MLMYNIKREIQSYFAINIELVLKKKQIFALFPTYGFLYVFLSVLVGKWGGEG